MPKRNIIDGFFGRHRFLSNFYPSPVLFEERIYPTAEHAYQAAKTIDHRHRLLVSEAYTPGEAKKLGRHLKLRSDWESIKLSIMEQIVEAKFEPPTLRSQLLATGDAELIEENYWRDRFWGVYRGEGENHLGKILMKIRTRIREREEREKHEEREVEEAE